MKKEDIIELLGITLAIVVLIRIFYLCIQNLFSITDGYSAATLTSALLVAIATVIYVIYTYRIFDATNKNTEQTAKAQKIAYLERRLELFYLPLQRALIRFDIDEMILRVLDPKMNTRQHAPYLYFEIIAIWWEFRTEYEKVIPFTYLTSDNVKDSLDDFTNMFESNKLFAKKYTGYIKEDVKIYTEISALLEEEWGVVFKEDMGKVYNYYDLLLRTINGQINLIRGNLTELVNL